MLCWILFALQIPLGANVNRFFVEEVQLNLVRNYRVLEIPVGHYSVVSLAAAVQTALNASGSVLGGTYTCIYN